MSKMKELSMVLDELVTCGETLICTANALRDIFSGETIATDQPAVTKPASKNTKNAPESEQPPAAEEKIAASESKSYTKEQVRGILAAKSAEGHGDEIRALLLKFGAKQLKQVDPKDYAALVQEAEVIGNE